MIAWDTETYPIGPGDLTPRIVCLSACDGHAPCVVGNDDWRYLGSMIEGFLRQESVGHNVAYDLAVVHANFPSLRPLIWQALEEGRVHDTMIREKLYYLGTAGQISSPYGQRISYSLAATAKRRVGLELGGKEGDDAWRVNYYKLDGIPARDYPKEAYAYAAMDARATWEVWDYQEKKWANYYKAEALHVKAAFCLYLMTAHGLDVDEEEKARIETWVNEELHPTKLPLLYLHGVMLPAEEPVPYANGARDHVSICDRKKGCLCPPKMSKAKPERLNKTGGLVPRILQVCSEQGIPVNYTDKGSVATDGDWIAELAPFDPVLQQYQLRQEVLKLRTSYLPGIEWPFASGETAERIYPQYDALKKTSRVSSRGVTKASAPKALYPSVNIQQADPRVRSVYRPRPGRIFAVCDYSSIDLCSLAQTIYSMYGRSVLRDQINAGICPHAYLGSQLAFDGDREFRNEAKHQKDAYKTFMRWKTEKPEFYAHWRKMAKPVGLGYPGGLGIKTMVRVCAGYGFRISETDARRFRSLWLGVYPEMNAYFGWVDEQDGTYTSPLGTIRAGCSFTELANGKALQTPAAEGMKEGMFLVSQECYAADGLLSGSRPVINMHDELVVEVDDDPWATRKAERISELMIQGMQKILPDVRIKAAPVLTERWVKEADDPLILEDGTLGVWRFAATAAAKSA